MSDASSGSERGMRLLIVGDLGPGEQGMAVALGSRGVHVALVRSPADALRTLRRDGADAVVLVLPLAGTDPVAACAALKEGPEAPTLLVADASGQAAALEAALPEERRPDALLARPLDPVKLVLAAAACAQTRDAEPEATSGVSLAELLMDRKTARATEVLEVRAAGVCTAIHLLDGQPVFAEGGALPETLGRQLVRRGRIGHDDYVRVVARMTEAVIRHESLRLGEVLVELGLLSPAEVYDALALQVREKILACFQWERFAWDIHEAFEGPEDLGIYQCPPTEALILAGIRAHYGPERVEAVLEPHAHAAPSLRAPFEAVVAAFHPTPTEQRLLRALDGRQSVEALARSGILDPLHSGQVLSALTLAGALSFRGAKAPARPAAAADEFPARRAPRAAPARPAATPPRPDAPRRRAPTAAAGAAPPRPAADAAQTAPSAPTPSADAAPAAPPRGAESAPVRPPAPAPKQPASEAAAAARRAFDPLAQLRRRMGIGGPGAKHGRLEAEDAFNQGLRLLRESALPGALREFRRAVERMPEEPEYRLLEAWLEYRTAHGADARPLAAAKVRACAERVLRASRTSARAYGILGQLALQEGEDEAAERWLRVAMRYDASDVETQRALRLLERRHRGKAG